MRIAFLQACHSHKRFNENFQVVDRRFGVFPDLGLAMAASVARDEGHEVRMWDAYATGQTVDEVRAEMRGWGAQLLAAAYHSIPTIRDTLDWASRIRESLGIPMLVGGHESHRYTAEVMTHDVVDWMLVGAAHHVLPAFLHAFDRDTGWEGVPGLVWRDGRGTRMNESPPGPQDGWGPVPARDLLPNASYTSHVTQRGLYTVILTSRGCPHGCTFCAVARSPYVPRAIDDVVREMEECIDRLGIHEFDVFDPLLLHDRRRVLDLCSEISTRRLDMEFACRSRVDDVDAEVLRALSEAGCRRIYFGIESGDPGILQRIGKRIRPGDVHRVMAMTRDHGIRPLGFFQIGHPGETLRSARRTIGFALDLPLDYAQFMRTIAKPGSRLHAIVMTTTGTDPWRDYVLGLRDDSRLPTPWTRLGPRAIDALVREAYLRFYARPAKALHTLRRSRSIPETMRYISVGLEMMVRGADR